MRRFVVVLAGFGLVLLALSAAGYVYFRGQIPPVQTKIGPFVILAEEGISLAGVLSELQTATERFERVAGPLATMPPLEIAIVDEPKQMNAVSLYAAIREALGTPAERLPRPFPTPRLVRRLLGQPEQTSVIGTGRRSLAHEAGHWLLQSWLRQRHDGGGERAAAEVQLPGWLSEGIAGYGEPTENRLGALLRVRATLKDSTAAEVLDLTRLLKEPPPETAGPARAHADGSRIMQDYDNVQSYYDQALLLTAYLEALHPSTVRKWLQQGLTKEQIEDSALLHDEGAFRAWILSVPPLSL